MAKKQNKIEIKITLDRDLADRVKLVLLFALRCIGIIALLLITTAFLIYFLLCSGRMFIGVLSNVKTDGIFTIGEFIIFICGFCMGFAFFKLVYDKIIELCN